MDEPQIIRNGESYDLDTREHMDNGVSVHMCPNDTREQLEADVREWIDIATYKTFKPERMFEVMLHWLNRQVVITEREIRLRELYSFEENHRASIDKSEEVNRKLNDRIAELTAERDRLQADLKEEGQNVNGLSDENLALRDKVDELRKAIDAMENGQFYAMYDELRAEVDNLRKRNDNQADTIRRLRAGFDAALDDLARAVEDKRSHPF